MHFLFNILLPRPFGGGLVHLDQFDKLSQMLKQIVFLPRRESVKIFACDGCKKSVTVVQL